MTTPRRRGPRARRDFRPNRTTVALAMAVFLTLAGTSMASALWRAAAVNPLASASSATVSISQSGFDQLAFRYSSSALKVTKPITITNGTVPAAFTLVLGSASSTPTNFAQAISVRTWGPVVTANCLSTSTPPPEATTSTWSGGTTLSGTLAAGGTMTYCVQAAISSTTLASSVGATMSARLNLSAAVVGTSWTSSTTTVTAIQSVPNTAPRNLTLASKTDSTVTLSWSTPTDATGVAKYQVYRGSTALPPTADSTVFTFTDTGRSVGTTYSYTVYSVDASGNLLAPSAPLTVTTTAQPDSSKWYKVVSGDLCVAAPGVAAGGTKVTVQTCGETNQAWKFALSSGNYTVVARHAPSFHWTSSESSGRGMAVLGNDTKSEDQWTIAAVTPNGNYHFVNGKKGQCLDVSTPSANAQVDLNDTCDGRDSESFTLTAVE